MGSTTSHVLLFPFLSKGHTIPLLHFAKILLRRSTAVTVITTPANRPFIADSLEGTAATIATIPFPDNSTGVESTDKLPSMSLFTEFATATSAMQPHFEQLLETLPSVSFMVTDGFLWWTLQSAKRFGVPRFVYYGMSCYSVAISREASASGVLGGSQPENELVTLTRFPWIRVSKEDFDLNLRETDPNSPEHVFHMQMISTTFGSYGILVNNFYELEPSFVDYMEREVHLKNWCVGPFCLAEPTPKVYPVKPTWVTWLDEKLEEKRRVVYVAFGSQAEISREQLEEIAVGLEESKVSFLWVIRKDEWGLPDGFEKRVRGRGIVVREWVDQREILMHESVEGFVSHCGWNSVIESICGGVPILAWPMMADQFVNARMVEEELKMGFRVETCDGFVRGFVKWEEVRKKVMDLMEGENGKKARERVKELSEMAHKAVEVGGSSCSMLNSLLNLNHGRSMEHVGGV